MSFKPRLLSETAEIAFTEIKRFVESQLMDAFSLRRVSAPLYLPVESELLDPRHPGARINLPGERGELEIVGSLDVWLRGQLARYDIAPDFGVFAIMNAIRPDIQANAVSSPYVSSWAWQQVIDVQQANRKHLSNVARKMFALLVDAEKKILELFPHLNATLPKNLEIMGEDELIAKYPNYGTERRIYEYLHPESSQRSDADAANNKHCAALFVCRSGDITHMDGEIWVWNRIINRPLCIADLTLWGKDLVAERSVGGNIYRDCLALQVLHQNKLLV